MDGSRFDALARSLSAQPTRRGVLKALAGAALGGLLGARAAEQTAAACGKAGAACDAAAPCCAGLICPAGKCCKGLTATCGGNAACCSKNCVGGACCKKPGAPCTAAAKSQCCSGVCATATNTCACAAAAKACSADAQCCSKACNPSTKTCCPAGTKACGGQCVSCPKGGVCAGTSCVCPSGTTDCGGRCVSGIGSRCATGLPGVCATGVRRCENGGVVCVPDVQPGSQPETCNGLDDDCDGVVDNGASCPSAPNALAACIAGVCTYGCAEGYDDCNADISDGCETHLASDPQNCGACGVVCPLYGTITGDAIGSNLCTDGRCACRSGSDCPNPGTQSCVETTATIGFCS